MSNHLQAYIQLRDKCRADWPADTKREEELYAVYRATKSDAAGEALDAHKKAVRDKWTRMHAAREAAREELLAGLSAEQREILAGTQ